MRLFRRFKQPWSERVASYVAVTTLVLAGCATLATFQAATYGNEALLAQTESSSCLAYYQAKSIKEHMFRLHRDLLPLVSATSDNALMAQYDEEIERYRREKYALMQKASELEDIREDAEQRATSFGEALIFLQVGILFSSLASVNRIVFYWYGACLAGFGGLVALLIATFAR